MKQSKINLTIRMYIIAFILSYFFLLTGCDSTNKNPEPTITPGAKTTKSITLIDCHLDGSVCRDKQKRSCSGDYYDGKCDPHKPH